MKESAWDNKLWHDKMQELPIPGDENSAWGAMRALLDENMPVETPVVKLPGNPFGTRLISVLAAIIIAGMLYYAALRLYPSFIHKPHEESKEKIKPFDESKTGKPNATDVKPGANNSKNTAANNTLTVIKPGKTTAKNTTANTTPSGGKNMPAEASKNAPKTAANLNSGGVAANNRTTLTGQTLVSNRSHHTAKATRLNNRVNNPNFAGGQNGQNGISTNTQNPANALTNITTTGNKLNRVNDAAQKQQKNIDSVNSSSNQNTDAANPPTDIKNTANDVANTKQTNNATPASTTANNKLPGKTPHRKMKRYPQTNQVFKLKNSKFELNINGGYNANAHPSAFIGIAGAYYIAPKLSLGLDVQILPSKVITGSYHNSNYEYSTIDGSGARTTQTAGNIVVNSSAKFYSIDVPIIAYYHINKYISVNAGPVIVFPVYNDDLKNTLGPLNKPADSLSAYRSIVSAADHTTITTKIGVNLSAGLRVNISRYFLDANYVQGLSPYTISSSLGSDKVYYHTFQFGIGYYIYRPLPKSKVKH